MNVVTTRKLAHMAYGTVLILLIMNTVFHAVYLLVAVVLGVLLSYLVSYVHIPGISFLLKKLGNKDLYPGQGMIEFTIGSLLSVILFEPSIALAAIAILTFGDGVSALIRQQHQRKFLHMTSNRIIAWVGSTIAATVGALIFLPVLAALIASAVAMLVESIEMSAGTFGIDDNILVPLVAGIVLTVISMI